jgi:hypothetical protein
LKPITDFEFPQGIVSFVSVIVLAVCQIRDALQLTNLGCLRHQRIRRPNVKIASFCSQIQDRRDISAINQVQKAYKFATQIGTNEVASTDKFTVKLSGLL